MKFKLPIRITRTKRCKEGFFLLVNGQRLWFKRRSAAIESLDSLLSMQRFQILSVRDYAASRQNKSKPPA